MPVEDFIVKANFCDIFVIIFEKPISNNGINFNSLSIFYNVFKYDFGIGYPSINVIFLNSITPISYLIIIFFIINKDIV